MDESKYLAEVKGRLRREGLTAETSGEAIVTVSTAGHERDSAYGVEFITWERTYDRAGVWQGHYYEDNYSGARQDFAVRSGLLDQDRLFTNEQLTEVYRCIHETLDSEYPITDSRREILQNACIQIENAVSNLDELVQQSNQDELELGASQLGQEPFISSY